MSSSFIACALILGLLSSHALFSHVSARIVDPMEQGFLFDWSGDQSPPVPVAAQCDTLSITWGRRSATGPDPVAPYFLQVYTSAFVVPFVIPAGSGQSFQWPLPFIPGTLFQICMFASNGVTGGCQQIYSITEAPSTTPDKPPVCQNLTYPPGQLEVQAKVGTSDISQYGWINQCSDILITPVNGTPPYTYTVAPALRPPMNFTSDTKDTVDWTVSLAYGLPFFISVQDSRGWSWTNGPLHASNGSTACLSAGFAISLGDKGLSVGGAVGVAIGTLIIGVVVGTIGAWLLLRKRNMSERGMGGLPLLHQLSADSPSPGHSRLPSTVPHNLGSPRDIDPFIFSQDSSRSPRSTDFGQGGAFPHTPQSLTFSSRNGAPSTHQEPTTNFDPYSPTAGSFAQTPAVSASGVGGSHVYVVHHDAGRPPPVTLFTSDGTQVVELPPQYESAAQAEGQQAQATSAPPQAPRFEGQRRQPRALPPKPGSS